MRTGSLEVCQSFLDGRPLVLVVYMTLYASSDKLSEITEDKRAGWREFNSNGEITGERGKAGKERKREEERKRLK